MRRTQTRAAASGSRLSIFKGLLFTLIAVGIWVFVNIDNLHEFLDTYQKREGEREQIEQLKQRIRVLKRQQQSLAYNGVESEKQIRERMGLHLPGEQVLFLKDEAKFDAAAEQPANAGKPLLIPVGDDVPSAAKTQDDAENPESVQENKSGVNKRKQGQ